MSQETETVLYVFGNLQTIVHITEQFPTAHTSTNKFQLMSRQVGRTEQRWQQQPHLYQPLPPRLPPQWHQQHLKLPSCQLVVSIIFVELGTVSQVVVVVADSQVVVVVVKVSSIFGRTKQ